MPGKTKEKAAGRRQDDQNKMPDPQPSETADRGYYYDDAHGYEPYVPDDEDEDAEQPPRQDQLPKHAVRNMT